MGPPSAASGSARRCRADAHAGRDRRSREDGNGEMPGRLSLSRRAVFPAAEASESIAGRTNRTSAIEDRARRSKEFLQNTGGFARPRAVSVTRDWLVCGMHPERARGPVCRSRDGKEHHAGLHCPLSSDSTSSRRPRRRSRQAPRLGARRPRRRQVPRALRPRRPHLPRRNPLLGMQGNRPRRRFSVTRTWGHTRRPPTCRSC
jgi:hypothetical protein